MEKIKYTVIGAGVVGLAVASKLSEDTDSLFLIEKNKKYGLETSSRNSEVIHGGMYYPTNSLKAKLCVRGNKLLYEICEKNNILCKKTGKLIIANNDKEREKLKEIYEQGIKNKVKGLKFLEESELKKQEPNIIAKYGIYSETTGIINIHGVMDCFAKKIKRNGAEIVCGTEVINIEKSKDIYEVKVKEFGGEEFSFESEYVINCAGLNSDKIAELVGLDIKKENYELHYCKGDYFSVVPGKDKNVNSLIYPVPPDNLKSLGIHTVLKLEGNMSLGPSAYYIDRNNFDYKVDETKKEDFYNSIKDYLPNIKLEDLNPEMSGVRPKLQIEGGSFRDFIIREESDKGLTNFINLIGIDSPGLTSAPAIAEYVFNLIKNKN